MITVLIAVQVWRIQGHVSTQAVLFLEQLDETLATTESALDVAEDALHTTSRNLATLGDTLKDAAKAIEASRGTLGDVGLLLQDDMPDSVRSTQTAIASAQTTAGIIDDTLARLSRLPLVGSAAAEYQPDVALAEALGDVGDSLDPVPKALVDVGVTLETASADLGDIANNISTLGEEVQTIDASVSGAVEVIDEYREQLVVYRRMATDARDAAPWLFRTIAVGLTFVLLWLGLLQGWVLVRGVAAARGDTA